ncbi:MAG: hypothetical protein ACOYM5_03615 [Caulobacter sp.]|jgi:hypothetical protein
MLRPWDIVTVGPDVEDAEIRGLRGHICSAVEADQIGVFIDDLERVWCLHPRDVIATGEMLPEAERPGGRSIRVNQKGEVVG